jgi:hypothetical protein
MSPNITRLGRALRANGAGYGAAAGLIGAAALIAAIALPASPARAGDLIVRYDQSQLLRLPRPVADIIIGNPSIADVTVQASNLLVVTGKTFGVTNIIALDAERNVIQDQRVVVQQDGERTVNLMKAEKRQSYSCTPNCSPTLVIGNETAYFDTLSKHAKDKMTVSDPGSAKGSSQQDGQ